MYEYLKRLWDEFFGQSTDLPVTSSEIPVTNQESSPGLSPATPLVAPVVTPTDNTVTENSVVQQTSRPSWMHE